MRRPLVIILPREATREVSIHYAWDSEKAADYTLQRIGGVREIVRNDMATRFREPFWGPLGSPSVRFNGTK
jgi:hypothetical protein